MSLSTDFIPVYDDSVREYYVEQPQVPVVSINPNYCLTSASACVLAKILADLKPKIYLDTPWPTYGPWAFNHKVPFITFTLADGTVVSRNAALLASYWTMAFNGNFSVAQAESYCRADIAGTF
jgi:hypothetical protein